jgi:amino acid adenylation domain-containing protein
MKLPPEQEAMLAKCFHPSGNFVEFLKEDIETSIPKRFEEIVRTRPDRLAIKTPMEALTYDELNRAANRVAHMLIDHENGGAQPVALLFENGVQIIIAMLGVLKAGHFFVLLDPSFPKEKIATVLAKSQARLVLSDARNLQMAREIAGVGSNVVDFGSVRDGAISANCELSLTPQTLSYIVYTSGSTGEPKGVIWSHQTLLHHVMVLTNIYHICIDDRLGLMTSMSGAALSTIAQALLNGATLYPYDVQRSGISELGDWLRREQISIWFMPSPLFRNMAATVGTHNHFSNVRILRLRSDRVHKSDIELCKNILPPSCIIVTGLATTETGTIRINLLDQETINFDNEVPVGFAVEDKEIFLMDDDDKEVGFNEVGEIVVRSKYLSPGYWHNPELTNTKFKCESEDPDKRIYYTGDLGLMRPDGCLIHKGRKDFRIKIRGYGVDLVEVEKAMLSHPGIREAVVVSPKIDSGETRLVSYYTSDSEPGPTISTIRAHLKEKLADYMVPSVFVKLEGMPLTANGKIDRRALPEPDSKRPNLGAAYVMARDNLESRLVRLWEDVLDVRPIGIDDNFFDLGGHSLLAARLFACLDDEFGRLLPLSVLVDSPTVHLLANHFRSAAEPEKTSALVPFTQAGNLPAIFAVPGVYGNVVGLFDLCRELGKDRPCYGLQSIGLDGQERAIDSLEAMAKRYLTDVRSVQPHGPYILLGACFGARVTCEMAYQLIEAGEEIGFLGFLDPIGLVRNQRSGHPETKSPNNKQPSNFLTTRMQLYFNEMRDRNNYERAKFLTQKVLSLGRTLTNNKARRAVQREMHQLAVFNASRVAGRRYRLKRLDGPIRTLEIFVSEHPRKIELERFDWTKLWEGNAVLHHVPGKDSGDMLSGENARVLGALLREQLKKSMDMLPRQRIGNAL